MIFSIVKAGACAPLLFQPNAMKKNDCYQCPHREQVPGSAHSQCNAIKNGVGEVKNLKNLITLDPHGVKMGWCFWPINFDPVWVKCYLPIENNENQ